MIFFNFIVVMYLHTFMYILRKCYVLNPANIFKKGTQNRTKIGPLNENYAFKNPVSASKSSFETRFSQKCVF